MKSAILLVTVLLLAGCTTAYQAKDGSYVVPRTVEVRSPFGTNAGFVMIERCAVKNTSTWFASYTDCQPISKWKPTQSQGQGGQVAAGAMIGLGFGLGAAFAPASSTSASSSSASTATAVTHGGHR